MKLTEAFNELDTLYEEANVIASEFKDRQILIDKIRATGRNYNFDRWSDTQLYSMWQRIQKEEYKKKVARNMLDDIEKEKSIKYCRDCGTQLSDNGTCHICDPDFGWDESLDEGMFDGKPDNNIGWISRSTGKRVGNKANASNNVSKPAAPSNNTQLFYAVSDIPIRTNHKSYYYNDFGFKLGDLFDAFSHKNLFVSLKDAEDFADDIFYHRMPDELFIMQVDINVSSGAPEVHFVKRIENPANKQQANKQQATGKLYYAVSLTNKASNHDLYFFEDDGEYDLGDINDLISFVCLFVDIKDAEAHAMGVFNDANQKDVDEVHIISVDIVNTDFKFVKTIKRPSSTPAGNQATKNIVTIVKDSGRLRAQADDGVHGKGFVAFPVAYRNNEGDQFEVENLTWNGKNYRASGKITPINTSNTSNDDRYCIATEEFPDTYDGVFVFSNIHTDKATGKKHLKYGVDSFWSLEKHDFDYDIADARDRVRDIMRQYPNTELHIIKVTNNDEFETVQSFW